MIDKNSQTPPKKTFKADNSIILMRPFLTAIIGTLDLMREGVFNDLDQEKKDQLINNAFMDAQKLNMVINKSIAIKPQAGKDSLARFYITLLGNKSLAIPPQS